MHRTAILKSSVRAAALALVVGFVSTPLVAGAAVQSSTRARPLLWAAQSRVGDVQLKGQVPNVIAHVNGQGSFARTVGAVSAPADISLNFGLPLRNVQGLNALIVAEARTHRELTRTQIYARFSPPQAQYNALRAWLRAQGFTVTHLGRDRLEVTAKAPASVIERTLHVQLNVYRGRAFTFDGVKIPAQDFYANTTAPVVPARLGLQSITGLTNVDSSLLLSDMQLTKAAAATSGSSAGSSSRAVTPHVRSGGYYPRDLRSMYDITNVDNYATGQTIGYTLWGAGENQEAASAFASTTGETALTVDTPCTASGSPTTPSACSSVHESSNHLLSVLENGDTNTNFGGNDETGLDVEVSHGVAPGAAEKYYLGDCSATPSPGLTNGNSCNGSDVGLEDAIEDAANDPTLHAVSDSWIYGGDPEFGASDPFVLATNNNYAIAAAAGTTFYYGSGDTGTYEAGYPSDSPYDVGVGGTSIFSTAAVTGSGTATLSSEDLWAAEGSFCSNVFARPSWQNGAGVTANATCPGRAQPDISAIADTGTSVYECYSKTATTDACGSVGGTSVATPVMAGIEADTENFVAAQTYPGATPAIGFEGPIMYELGNSGNAASYYRDVLCGNDADPTASPDGEAALPGWDEASGWGAVDWLHYSTGYAMELGATGLATPSSLSQNYQWTCAKTPGNSTEHGISFPSSTVGYAAGTAATAPWFSTYLPSGSWGATNTFYKTTNGGSTWVPANADMMDIACTTSTTCVEVGDGGVIQLTTNGGSTWTSVDNSGFNQALTQVQCPSSSVCFAAGDRGTILQSSNGGATWSYSPSVDGNPIYGLSCPTTTNCYTTDDYGHVEATTNGGQSWTLESTPVTTPAVNVPGSGGPNPFSGLFGISCSGATTCVAVGIDPQTGNQEPIEVTTDGVNWTADTSGDASNGLFGVSCVAGTTTCFAVGAAGTILTSTDETTWTAMTSGTTKALTGITCLSTTSCVATGQSGTIDVLSGTTWTPASTTLGSSAFLAGVSCLTATNCFATGHQGVTVSFDSTNVASTVAQLNGGGYTGTIDALSCPTTTNCIAVGASGTIIATTNGGQTWLPQTDPLGTSPTLEGVSCSGSTCVVVATSGDIIGTSTFGSTWTAQTSGITQTIEGVSCTSSFCAAVTAVSPTDAAILTSTLGSGTWTKFTTTSAGALDGVNCAATSCEAVGAVVSGHPIVYGTSNSGTTWTSQSNTATEALSSVACVDANDCYAGGTNGTVLATNNGGATWSQQGNPLSGPTSALNTGTTTTSIAIDGAACSSTACGFAASSDGNIMMTQVLTVTVNQTGQDGSTPPLSGLSPTNAAISYSPSAVAPSVTGSLTCSTNATNTSPPGPYSISGCAGLAASGYNVIYNYAGSSYTVTPGNPTATINSPASGGTYVVGQSVPTSFTCAENLGGPGITSCVDSNGSTSPGALTTTTPGTFTYTVTATSSDSLTGTASITYTVAGAPTATITSPATGGTYSVGESVPTSFSCSEGSFGPGLASCTDSNGASSPSGSLDTSVPGTFTYTVTATSTDGQTGTASISYSVASGPTATITSPATGGTYSVGQSVPTSFSCSDSTFGPGITSCTDSNGASSPSGSLDTSAPGTFTYTVTATSGDGQTATASITYTVAGAPTASITSPATGGTYSLGQSVPTSFSCSEGSFGPGLASCTDSNGASSPSGELDTSALGTFTYTVTATSTDGQSTTTSISYSVAAAPSAQITSPSSGATYAVGQTVATSFSCSDSAFGPGIQSCTDSNGASSPSGALTTSAAGRFTYTVTATSTDGQSATASISYTVAAAPRVTALSPTSGGTYYQGELKATSFTCADGSFGPGIATCVDSNGAASPGTLPTATIGSTTYSVIATSKDGQQTTHTITFTVAAAPTATISSPGTGATYEVGQSVPTSFSCSEGQFGTGLSSCKDSNGVTNGTGSLKTTQVGSFSYSVTAKSTDGATTTTTITYSVATPPTARITSPATGGTYAVGQSVPTSFSCSDSPYGPGIESCTDSNGQTSGSGALTTTTAGKFTYTVTALSADGQTASASISYTVAKAPTVTVSPTSGGTYYEGQVKATTFSCADGSFGPGIQSCTDSNGATSGTGALSTTTLGSNTYTVTATSKDGQQTSHTITYTVAGLPSATITSPTTDNTYALHQRVTTSFSCHDGSFGPGISYCLDSNGSTNGSGLLTTSSPGTFSYTVTAKSLDGGTSTTSISYTVS